MSELEVFFKEFKNAEENLTQWEQIAIDFKHNEKMFKGLKKG